jgi:hypothetical protein
MSFKDRDKLHITCIIAGVKPQETYLSKYRKFSSKKIKED